LALNSQSIGGEFREQRITLTHLVGWLPNLIPRNIIVYLDPNKDGRPDAAWVTPIQVDYQMPCDAIKKPEQGWLLFTTCGGGLKTGHVYLTRDVAWFCHVCMGQTFVPAWVDPKQGYTMEHNLYYQTRH